jgi:hypothetical protein
VRSKEECHDRREETKKGGKVVLAVREVVPAMSKEQPSKAISSIISKGLLVRSNELGGEAFKLLSEHEKVDDVSIHREESVCDSCR